MKLSHTLSGRVEIRSQWLQSVPLWGSHGVGLGYDQYMRTLPSGTDSLSRIEKRGREVSVWVQKLGQPCCPAVRLSWTHSPFCCTVCDSPSPTEPAFPQQPSQSPPCGMLPPDLCGHGRPSAERRDIVVSFGIRLLRTVNRCLSRQSSPAAN